MAQKVHRSKISNTEWGMVIAVLVVIDIVQFILTLFVIGVAINRFITFVVGIVFSFYLHIRGESMADPKRLLRFIAAAGLEFIPVVDALPLWSVNGVVNFILARHRNKEADKHEAKEVKEKKQQQKQQKQEQNAKIMEMRQRQQMEEDVVDNDD